MATFSSSVSNRASATTTGVSLFSFLSSLFAVELREELDAKTGGDKAFAAWAWGL